MINLRLRLVILACAVQVAIPATADSPPQDCKQTSDPHLAIQACNMFLKTAQGNEAILGNFYLAIAYFDQHDFYHAAKGFDLVIGSGVLPTEGQRIAFLNRGLAYLYQIPDNPAFAEQAISDFNKADSLQLVDKDSRARFSGAYVTRAETNLESDADQQAQEDEAEALHLNPENAKAINADFADAYRRRAVRRLAAQQYDQAVNDLQKAMDLDPTATRKLTPYLTEAKSRRPGPYAAMARGDQDLDDLKYEQALKDYTDAVQADPNLADAHLARGYVYKALDRFDDARTDFNQAIRSNQNAWSGYYARGRLYQSMYQFDKAAADFDEASAIIEKNHDLGYEVEKEQIVDARKSLKFDRGIQDHWISYLKKIQAANTYQNWSGPPYDLFVGNHSLRTDVAGSRQSGLKDDLRRPRRPILAVVILGIIVIIALFAMVVLFRGS